MLMNNFMIRSQDDYGKTQSEVATIVGGAYATLHGYGSGTPRRQWC